MCGRFASTQWFRISLTRWLIRSMVFSNYQFLTCQSQPYATQLQVCPSLARFHRSVSLHRPNPASTAPPEKNCFQSRHFSFLCQFSLSKSFASTQNQQRVFNWTLSDACCLHWLDCYENHRSEAF